MPQPTGPQPTGRANTDPSFVGVEQIKKKQREQLTLFRQWAQSGQWRRFHSEHYDWWMFPIDQPSAYGKQWTVYEREIAALKQDSQYIDHYLEGVALLAASWGWDLQQRAFLPNPTPDQRWHDWPIRLHKAANSLRLFGFAAHFDSLREYALLLIAQGTSFQYRGKDLSQFFVARPSQGDL